ncbi:polysaccharide biosynthesis tyrosine autokinase [Flexivirga sp. ID2601S]|uniref:non-specific protein-tyrosine kinase n=1 Tax=Flexivirga aerilata TaxID=1656889 RepID=A0A849AJB4_9MICO|nr:polysaccharide biosynthesis tyrosine autokinase [Flexivirga aerilata]NNG40083.1 polysaccharide biosynthesis tyrosine autokinase [Flexivirga aerilata]
MTLREFFAILRARWKIILVVTVLVAAAAAAASFAQPKVYQASTSVYLTAQSAGQGAIARQDLLTYTQVIDSPEVTGPLRQDAGVSPSTPIGVKASVSASSNVLNITATAPTGAQAAAVANATGPALAKVAPKFSSLLAGSNSTVTSQTITPATAPGSPTSPKTARNIALGLLLGLLLGCSAALLRHAFDTRIRSVEDLQGLSDRPVLGELPLGAHGLEPDSLVEEPVGAAIEATRRLRTNVRFASVTTGKHAIVVTSPAPGDGKTTTAVALALAMARDGADVLLVDCDLRRPNIASVLGLEGGVGLTTVLLGNASTEEVTQRWHDTTLDVLPAGELPPNPTELLGSEPMQQTYDQLIKRYDFVVIDSPPLLPVIDAVLLERLAGNLLMVVAADRTTRRDVHAATRVLETAGAQPSGFALNFVAKSGTTGRYGYSYSYGDNPRASTTRLRRRGKSGARAAQLAPAKQSKGSRFARRGR